MNDFYDRALRRIQRIAAAVGAIGSLAALIARGPRVAAGFLIGAILSLVNFRWWIHLANALGPSQERPLSASTVFLSLRYLLLGGAIYVIVKILKIALPALLSGLFVSAAAVMIEILYELTYARK